MTGDLIISGVILAAGLSYLAYATVIGWGTRLMSHLDGKTSMEDEVSD